MGPLSGAALVLGFVLLFQRRARGCIAAGALQAWVVAIAAGWRAWVQGEPQLYLVAAAALAVNGVLLPRTLGRISQRPKPLVALEPALGTAESMLLGVLLVVVAVLAARPAISGGGAIPEDFAVALCVMLLGLGSMIAWRSPLVHAVGFLSLGNGLILQAVAVPTMATALAAPVLAMEAFAVLGLSFVRERGG